MSKEIDPKLISVCKLCAELFPGVPFFVAIAPLDGTALRSMSNLSTELQLQLMRALFKSFDSGSAVPTVTFDMSKG